MLRVTARRMTLSAPRPNLQLTAWPPARRPRALERGSVMRARLVRRLMGARDLPLVVLAAPAGYGKTTTLLEWAQHDPRPFVWLSLERVHDDPDDLRAALAVATAAVYRHTGTSVVVVDDLHVLRSHAAVELFTSYVEHPPRGAQVVVASRSELHLRVGRRRAHRQVLELGARDFATTRSEAAELLELAGVVLDDVQVDALVERTEGWPVGLYLAALSLRDEHDVAAAIERFGGDDRAVSEYVADAVLADLDDGDVGFLLRTSVLDRLSGDLCDAVLCEHGTAARLRRLARANVLLLPLDRTDEWYRYHAMLAQALRAELRRREPELEYELHRRASRWHARHGDVESAIRHAAEAGDAELAGDLLRANVLRYLAEGRTASVSRWLRRFSQQQTAQTPQLALVAAIAHLVSGERALGEHWTEQADLAMSAAPSRATPSLEAGVAVLQAAIARDGVERMRDDAARARELEPDDSPWRSLACQLEGTARHLLGDPELARALLREGSRRGLIAAPSVNAVCLAQLALLAWDAGDRHDVIELAGRARAQVERLRLSDEPTGLVLAVSALAKTERRQLDAARDDAVAATRLLDQSFDLAPWYEAEVSLVLARVMVALGDVAGARALLENADAALRAEPNATLLVRWLGEARKEIDAYTSRTGPSPASLTTAELRVLRLLPTHLSFREMGSRLAISPNTVKSQAHAVYRKLDVSSRSEAVARAQELGLIDRRAAA
jgi:LuxR family transcriptional regulator, maltose regulon positive regulatory protein